MSGLLDRKQLLRITLSLVVTASLLGLVLSQGEMGDYLDHLSQANPWYFGLGLFTAIFSQWARAARLALLLNHRFSLPSRSLYRISAVHTALNTVLPARLGEAALPILLRREHGTDLFHGTGILVTARIYDLLIVLVFGGLGAMAAHQSIPSLSWLGMGTALIAGTTALLLPLLTKGIMALIHRWLGDGRLSSILERLARGILASTQPRDLLALIVLTLGIWGMIFLGFWLGTRSLDIALSPLALLFAGAVVVLAASQPINGIASLGVFEFFWATALRAMGYDWELAVAAALLTHAVNVSGLVMTAVGSMIFLPRDSGPAAQAPAIPHER